MPCGVEHVATSYQLRWVRFLRIFERGLSIVSLLLFQVDKISFLTSFFIALLIDCCSNFNGDNWPFMGPWTKTALTHRHGELCRATGPLHIISFSSVNLFSRSDRPAEGFLIFGWRFSTAIQSDSYRCRGFGIHVNPKTFSDLPYSLESRWQH